ncbi:hypothetical protein ACNHE5_01000 [Pandoraea pnomenusa]|uniref:hypothetical protein n=1 Tax=Pandoraea pnomenusa TaxID=93220 RepID=UPI003CFB2E65
MRNESHKTKLAILSDHVDLWRQRAGSRETVALQIVEAHKAWGGDSLPRLEFDMSGDAFTAAKNAADRIFRWLDDRSKDTNLLPANFERSILAAMPADIRLSYLNAWLAPVNASVRMRTLFDVEELSPQQIVQSIVHANHRTESDAADLLDGVDPGELPRLHNSLINDISVKKSLVGAVEAAMRTTGEAPIGSEGATK